MSKIKASIDFRPYLDAELSPIGQTIHDKLSAHADTFPTPPVAMPDLQQTLDAYAAALVAKAGRASASYAAFDAVRAQLEGLLSQLGHYVNHVAQGDAMIVEKSGFPSYSTARPPDFSAPAAPENVRLSHGVASGTIKALYRPARPRSQNEVQTCTGDPGVQENWSQFGFFSGGRAELTGLTPGMYVWVRIRTAGLRGVMGAWSDPAKIMVI